MKNTLKTIIYMSALCTFLFNTMQLHAAAVPAAAPAAANGYRQRAKTVWDTVVSPEALIALSLGTVGYTRSPGGVFVGSVGTLIGSAWMADTRTNWRKTAGLVGMALSGTAVGAQILGYGLLGAAFLGYLKLLDSR